MNSPPPAMLPSVSYHQYQPVEVASAYGSCDLTANGSVISRQPLQASALEHLHRMDVSPSLWDGSAGLHGIPYHAKDRKRERACTSRKALLAMRALYNTFAERGAGTRIHAFHTELRTLRAMHRKLSEDMVMIQMKKRSVQLNVVPDDYAPCQLCHMENPLVHVSHDAHWEELITQRALARVADNIRVLSSKAGEKQVDPLFMASLLNRVFEADPTGVLTLGEKNGVYQSLGQRAGQACKERQRAFKAMTLTMFAYIDAKKGLLHLYTLDSTLKHILHNLKVARTQITDALEESEQSPPQTMSTVSFRMRYIVKLRTMADDAFEMSVLYARFTPLAQNMRSIHHTRNRSATRVSTKSYCAFAKQLTVLLELPMCNLDMVKDASGIIGSLHEQAAATYNLVSKSYALQTALVKKIFADYLCAVKQFESAQNRLFELWDQLLAFS